MRNIVSMLVLLLLAVSSRTNAAEYTDTAMVSKDGRHKLLLSIPDNYSAENKYPLVIAIQPCNGSSYTSYVDALKPLTDSLHMIIACPDNSKNGGWITNANLDIITVAIDSAMSICSIDSQSVYLTGMSCNGEVTLYAGLSKLYPFKAIFPWAPYLSTVDKNRMDLDSDMPVTISVGTKDPYYAATLNMYDSLKAHGASVNLVLVPGIAHTFSFASFGKEMIHSLQYLNDSGNISLVHADSAFTHIDMHDKDPQLDLRFKVSDKMNKEIVVSALSGNTNVVGDPTVSYTQSDSIIMLSIQTIPGKTGNSMIVLEVREKDGPGIKQETFRVKVTKSVTQTTSVSPARENMNVSLYPNPARNTIYLKSGELIKSVQIVDMNGRILRKETGLNFSSIDISTLQEGLYFLRIIGKEKTKQILFVKQ